MRYALSWLLLLGMAAPVAAMAPDADSAGSPDPSLSVPSDLSGGAGDVAPSSEKLEQAAPAKEKASPEVGTEKKTDASSAGEENKMEVPSGMPAAEESKEECVPKKKSKKRRRKSKGSRAKSAANRRPKPVISSCGAATNEAFKAQNSVYLNRGCATPEPVSVNCDSNSSCGTAPAPSGSSCGTGGCGIPAP